MQITDRMIELAARNILRAEGVSWIEMDREWQADVATYRSMCDRWPDYAATARGELPNAFRAASAALSAALLGAEPEPVAWRWKWDGTESWNLREERPHPNDKTDIQPLFTAPPASDLREENARLRKALEKAEHLLMQRDRMAQNSRKFWVRAAKAAIAGDFRDLRNRVEMAEAPPMEIVHSDAALNPEGK